MDFPPIGSRVSIRYCCGDGDHTDVIGRLMAGPPQVEVRDAAGVVEIGSDDIVAVRELSYIPVRNSQIRALEHAAALGWPGIERQWYRGWLLRASDGMTSRGNSAVPLDFSSSLADVPPILEWYEQRDLVPWLAVGERLLAAHTAGVKRTRVMVRDVGGSTEDAGVRLSGRPDADWLACYRREVSVEELTAVVDGEVTFARLADVAVGRGALTTAPDGTRWLGISAVVVDDGHRRRGYGRAVCEAVSAWGARRGARRTYVQVLTDNTAAITLYASMGFGLHHHSRYLDARQVLGASLAS